MAQPRIKIPPTVRSLRIEAKKYYKLVYSTVAQGKESQELDTHAISILCVEYAKYLDATDAISKKGIIITNSRQDQVPHPAVAIQKSAMNNIKQIWNALGVTPEGKKKITNSSEPGKTKKKSAGVAVVKN